MRKKKVTEVKTAEPVWWRWKVPQIEAAEREPEKYARELAEMREYAARELAELLPKIPEGPERAQIAKMAETNVRAAHALAQMEAAPAMQLWRQHADDLHPLLPEANGL